MLFAAPAQAQEAEDVVTYQTKRTAYRVAGWEQGLVRTSPNLGQFIEDPQTATCNRMALAVPARSQRTNRPTSIYRSHSSMKCKSAPMPENHRAQFSAEQMAARTAVSANVQFNHAKGQLASAGRGSSSQDCVGVLSYGNNGDSAYGQVAGGGSRSQKLSVKYQIYGKGKN